MASIKIILRTSKINSAGEAPLCIRIIKNRKAKFIFLNYRIKPEYWDNENRKVKKSYFNSSRMNAFIAQKVAEAENAALKLETGDNSVSSLKIKEQVMGRTSESFIRYFERNNAELEHNQQMGSFDKAKSVLQKLKKYLKGRDLLFDEITIYWLRNFETYLRDDLDNKTNTVHATLKVIRKLINCAIREELFPYDKNPFLRYKLKWENVRKEFLTEGELRSLELLDLVPGSRKDTHRNMYVFACYTGGLRISDVLQLRWKNFDGEKILTQTQKTNSTLSIKLPSKALDILQQYKKEDSSPEHFIFPIFNNETDYSDKRVLFRAISSATAYTNTDLKDFVKMLGLSKHIHFHTSRHTWATRALQKGMRIEYVSKLMGHSNVKVTQSYAKIVNEELDKAMAVFN